MVTAFLRLGPTCRLHELYKNHVIKGHSFLTAVALHQLPPAAIACVAGGSIVNQSLGWFCLTHANLTRDVTETETNFAAIHVQYILDMYK